MSHPVLDPLGDPNRNPLRPYTVTDLCVVTGWSRPTVYGALEAGHLPGYQAVAGGKWVIPAQAFRDLCAGIWKPAPREIEITTRSVVPFVRSIDTKVS